MSEAITYFLNYVYINPFYVSIIMVIVAIIIILSVKKKEKESDLE